MDPPNLHRGSSAAYNRRRTASIGNLNTGVQSAHAHRQIAATDQYTDDAGRQYLSHTAHFYPVINSYIYNIYIYIYIYIYILKLLIILYVYIYICICVIYIYIIYIYICVCVCVCMYVCMYVCICVGLGTTINFTFSLAVLLGSFYIMAPIYLPFLLFCDRFIP